MDGGEARAITDVAARRRAPRLVARRQHDCVHASTRRGRREEAGRRSRARRKSDVKVVTRAVYRANGNPGYVDNDRHAHIFTIASPVTDDGGKPQRPGSSPTASSTRAASQWAPDGVDDLLHVDPRGRAVLRRRATPSSSACPAAGGAIDQVASIDGSIGNISVSPDGKRIAFVGTLRGKPIRSYSQSDLWVTDAAPGSTPKNLTADYDFDVAGGIGGDQSAPRGAEPQADRLVERRPSLIVVSAENGSSNLKRVTIATGKDRRRSPTAQHDIVAFTRDARTATIAATALDADQHRRHRRSSDDSARRADRASDHARQRRSVQGHRAERARRDLVQELRRQKIQGWILKPPDFDPVEEVSADPRDPRRPALGVRQRLHARVPVDGGEGLRRAVHEPARQHDLRPGVRQHHPVPLSRATTTRI